MASFSVDITEIVFAGARTGYKDITITGMPEGGVDVFMTDDDSRYFTYINNPESKGTNVYRVSTKSTNTSSSGSDRYGGLRISNKSDSSDSVYISLKQCNNISFSYYIEDAISNYSDVYASGGTNNADIYFPYSLSDSTTKAELYIDGSMNSIISITVPSWASYVKETTYTDTGFGRVLISCTNNYDGPRKEYIRFGNSSGSSNIVGEIYQNGYPSSTSGCTQSLSFLKSGGTQTIELKIPSTVGVGNIQYSTTGDHIDLSISAIPDTRLNYSVTVGNNNTGKDLELVVKFSGGTYLGHTIITQSSEDTPTPTLTVDPSVLTYPSSGGGRVMDVTYATSLSTNESSFPDWLGATYVSTGQGSGSYTITAASNTSTSSRSFDFELADVNMSLTVPITQEAGSVTSSISVSPSSLSFGADASYADISLTYGGTHYDTDAQEVYTWVTVNLSDTETGKAAGTVSVTSNTTTESRSGNVYFSDELGASIALPIEQAGISFALSANPSTLNIPASGGSVTTAVTYEGTLSAASLPSWLSETHTDNDANHRTYTVTAASNGPTQERTFNWKLDDDYNNIYVFISQAAAKVPSMVISPTSSSVDNSAGTVDITVRSTNISDISYSISDSWITYSSKSGSVYTFSYDRNTTASVRQGSITFSGGGISQTFKLSQGGTSYSVSPSSVVFPNTGGKQEMTITNRPKDNHIGVDLSEANWIYNYMDSDFAYLYADINMSSSKEGYVRYFMQDPLGEDLGQSVYISVSQGGGLNVFVSQSTLLFDSIGGTQIVTIKYNNSFNIDTSSAPDWLSFRTDAVSQGEVQLFVTATSNTSIDGKSYTLGITGGGQSTSLVIKQMPKDVPGIGFSLDYDQMFMRDDTDFFGGVGQIVHCGTPNSTSRITYTTSDSWLSVTKKVVSDYILLSVKAPNNTEVGIREGYVTVIRDNTDRLSFKVIQDGCLSDVSLNEYPRSLVFDAAGGSKFIYEEHIMTDKNTYPDWITQKSTSGGNTYTASLNDTGHPRSGYIDFHNSNYGYHLYVPVYQEGQGESDPLSVSPTELNFTAVGDTKSVTVSGGTGTIAVNTGSFPSWLSIASVGNGVYNITASENSGASRSFDVWFTDEAFNTVIVNVSQESSSVELTVSPSSKSFGSAGGSQVFRVTYNTRINYNTLPSWLSIVSGTTTGSSIEYTMTASENTDTSSRNFNWVLTDELTSVTVPISQSGTSGPGPEPEPVEEGSLKVYPEKLRYYSDGGRILVSFTNRPEAGIGYAITYTDGSGWLSVESVSPNMYVSATANDGIRRRAEIKFYDLSDDTNYVIVPVIQGSVGGYSSIWMDDLYYPENRDASGNYFYKVVNQDTGQIYFIGISSKPLSWSGNIGGIDVPRLVDNYIKSDFVQQNTGEDWADMNSGYCTVDIYNMAETNSVVDATFKYWNDWSRFERKYDYTRSLNDPINGKGCDNMIIPFCVYYDDEATFTIVDTDKNGSINTHTLSSPSSPFMMRYNSYYDIKKVEYKQDNEVLFSYDMNHCGPGAFIYRNRFGGWDSFLIEGNISKTDNYTKQNYRIKGEYNQEYVINTLKYIDEKRTDSIDIDTTYEASTGWLTDEESERLVFHLLSSPIVYFQNLHKENQLYDTDSNFDIIPVRITASSSEYKKFRNGRRLVNYLITFEKCNIEKVRQ